MKRTYKCVVFPPLLIAAYSLRARSHAPQSRADWWLWMTLVLLSIRNIFSFILSLRHFISDFYYLQRHACRYPSSHNWLVQQYVCPIDKRGSSRPCVDGYPPYSIYIQTSNKKKKKMTISKFYFQITSVCTNITTKCVITQKVIIIHKQLLFTRLSQPPS